ncbi:aminotransferase class V-fold PLP-dependent enzyme [Flavobacterium saccharophilum]|uniref:Selenocysteine lyase/Cysteine desulfurase n=1 Tax=Flavobacterium saccharophilum TaxID=29534 RepID=A0A1M7FT90_9FLAO|nr:aminotransferase class V-fold PLP-dependent enzyme [Flavobacterium saccharophilum]SHM07008.1 Selenocysteine lyase/Cysteine desulfurase [Flavobacterium saccharophilum]
MEDSILSTVQDNFEKVPSLEHYFEKFRENIIGNNHVFNSGYGNQKMIYADWIASGRLYRPIEAVMCSKIGPMVANTHSFSSESGKASTYAYQHARNIIKKHVNASEADILVTTGTGMTAALSKLQRIMGLLKVDFLKEGFHNSNDDQRPVVFITHMEHHSNQVPWYEINADVVILKAGKDNLVDTAVLEAELKKYASRSLKIGSFTACSNVTGIITPYHELAKIMHQHGGFCFVDFAASAPYVKIDMHPEDPGQELDAIFFSPHKFLGGPGSCGILVFNEKLYKSNFPDNPGGGNVKYTTPWGEFCYSDAIEVREDGGTPGFLQVMRTALCMELKTQMGIENMKNREKELLELCYSELRNIPNISLLGDQKSERIGCISLNIEDIHYNLVVRLLNDRFGVQVRGGWSCASTYAHSLFGIEREKSNEIIAGIKKQNLTDKPGWVRISLHPTMTDQELLYICNALKSIILHHKDWGTDYNYNQCNNEFENMLGTDPLIDEVKGWFSAELV